jgi:O-antigen ligase
MVQRGASDRTQVGGVLALVGAGAGASAALLAASKMAAMTIGAASVVVVVAAIALGRGRGRSVLLAGTVAGLAVLGAVGLFGPLRGRLADFAVASEGGFSAGSRSLAWTAGLRMSQDYPWTGSGFGAFPEVFPAYLPRGENDFWVELHNDYLEVYVAGGLVAVALSGWLAAAFGMRLARAVRPQHAGACCRRSDSSPDSWRSRCTSPWTSISRSRPTRSCSS